MSADPDTLRDLYLDVAGDAVLTQSQKEGPSREPIGSEETELEREVSEIAWEDGLGDAVAGAESSSQSLE